MGVFFPLIGRPQIGMGIDLHDSHRAAAAQRGVTESDVEAERVSLLPAGRFAAPEEIGSVCAFLCSAQAGYITGQNLVVDGGWYRSAF